MADKFSKIIDFDNWFMKPDLFDELTVRWRDVAKIDRFASEENWKTRYKAKFI